MTFIIKGEIDKCRISLNNTLYSNEYIKGPHSLLVRTYDTILYPEKVTLGDNGDMDEEPLVF